MMLWMLYAILFGALAFAAGFALERGVRALGLPTRFLWLAMLAAAVGAPFALSALRGANPSRTRVEFVEVPAANVGPIVPVAMKSSWLDRLRERAPDFDRPLLLIWIALSAVGIGRFVTGMLSLRRRRAHWVAREIGGTQCFVTQDIGPAVVSMPDTRIVVPEWVLSLDTESLATVIRHERQHKVARDGWLIVAGSLATALLPWNPAIWLLQRRLRLAIEMDCDTRVLAEGPRVDRYGSLLLAIAQRPRLAAGLAATLTESTSDLERRIVAMTARPPKHPRVRALLFATAGLVTIAIACGMPAPDMVAPRSVNPSATAAAPQDAYFDFQVEKPAAANPANMPPRYPDQLRAAGIQGSVIAKFVVDTTGRADMRSFQVMKSDHEGFTAAVREALPDMSFVPAQVGDHKVKQLIQMPFTFSIVRGAKSEAMADVGKAVDSPRARVVFETREIDPATRRPLARSEISDSTASIIEGQPPVYPAQLRAAHIEGMVQAKFVIRPDGKADMGTFMVIRSDHEAFTTAVRAAVEQLRFRPAMLDGKPVSKMVTMPFMFSLAR